MMPALYQCALLLVALSVPINRVAWVVIAAWMPGQIAHELGPYEDVANMAAYILALGAALAFARSVADKVVALIFGPMAVFAFFAVLGQQGIIIDSLWYGRYVSWSVLLFLQIAAVLAGNDWSSVVRIAKAVDDWIVEQVRRHIEGAL